MRIGILTYHCAHNYGAVLQCYALQEFLKQRGHDVYVIDYKPKAITDVYRWFVLKRIIRKNLYRAAKELLLLYWKKKRYDKFEDFINNKLHLAPVESIMKNPYDMIIVGSDQVWNYNLTNGFDEYYWGNFPHPASTRIVSYAASMQDNWAEEISPTIKKNLENFEYVSVRESSLSEKLANLACGRRIYQVADPTLLLTKEMWASLAIMPKIYKPYLLLFQVEGRNKRTEQIAEVLSKKKNLPIIRFTTFVDWHTSRWVQTTSPAEFIGLFMNAAFVVCSSFHGTVFSLIFNRPFVSVRMGVGKDNRVESILNALGMSDHFVDKIENDKDYSISFKENQLSILRNKSLEFINYIENETKPV